jgi:DNA polymerase III delta prime subunit
MDFFNSLWVEKYRPKTLDDMVISAENRAFIEKFRNNEIPTLLFVGNPGTGKTTLAKIIVNSILNTQYLYINASDENGIDTIRTKVMGFAQTRSITETVKVIILDEADGLSPDSQRALRNVMEEYSKHTRFILTANYKHRIIEPLRSRCQQVDLTFTAKLVTERIVTVLNNENVEYNIDTVNKIVTQCFPDIRLTINKIQRFIIDNKLVIENKQSNKVVSDLYCLIKKGFALKCRQYMIQKQDDFGNDFQKLLKDIFDIIDSDSSLEENNKKLALITVHDHIYKASFVADQEINAYVCLINLSKLLSS